MEKSENNAKWYSLASVWIGGMVSIPALLMGSTLIGGMTFADAIIAGLLGIAFVAVFMCFESVAATDQRMNTVQLAKSSFGQKGGTMLIGAIIGLATMGWFGVQTNIAGISFSKIMSETFEINVSNAFSSSFWGFVMLITAVYGFRLMKWLNYVAVPAIILLMVYGLFVSFQGKGWSDVVSFEPSQSMGFLAAIGLAIGFDAVGGVISPDINRFAKTRKDAIWGSLIGLLPAGVLLLAVGATLGILQGTHDITEIFSSLGYPVLALSILILATWTTNVVNAYSGGLALNQLLMFPESKRPIATLIAGIVGTILAVIGILDHFIGFLTVLTAAIPPVAGVLISDYWIARTFQRDTTTTFNWKGFISWALGVATIILMENAIKNLLAIFVSAILFWALNKFFPPKKLKINNP